jgi:hypothetical protein
MFPASASSASNSTIGHVELWDSAWQSHHQRGGLWFANSTSRQRAPPTATTPFFVTYLGCAVQTDFDERVAPSSWSDAMKTSGAKAQVLYLGGSGGTEVPP